MPNEITIDKTGTPIISMSAQKYVDMRVKAIGEQMGLEFKLNKRAVSIALEANEARLNNMNEWRATYSDLANKSMTRQEIEALIAALRSDTNSELRPLQVKVDAIGKNNWPVITSFIGSIGLVVTGLWLIIGLKIDAVNSPIQVELQTNKLSIEQVVVRLQNVEANVTASTQADALSRGDRLQLNTRLATVENLANSNTSEQRSNSVSTAAKLVEIETQFKSSSDAANVQSDTDQQLFSIIYETVFPGKLLPQRSFRPSLFK